MKKDEILTALPEGIPLVIKMADGEKYKVTDHYKIAVGRSFVIVIGTDDNSRLLPMRDMTGISFSRRQKE